MHPKPLALPAVVAASIALAAAPAVADEPAPPPAPAAAAFEPGYYFGRTAQRGRAIVHLRADRIEFWGAAIRPRCADGTRRGGRVVGEDVAVDAQGRFSATRRPGRRLRWSVAGRASGRTISGTVSATLKLYDDRGRPLTCSVRRVRFEATWQGQLR